MSTFRKQTSGSRHALPGKDAEQRVVPANFSRNTGIEIDALELRAIKRRFLALNKDRLHRVQDSLQLRQRIFIRLLPLLFHINHPMLPGYLSNKTPCGISDFTPGKRCIQAARKLAKSFSYRRRAQRRYSIHGLYLMGSTGTIAYSKSSDFDIWICHRPGLPAVDIATLREKADGVQSWAESLGLEVHFFLMDDISFRQQEHQQLSNENAGSSQHHLLLDEFYRTGLLVAGRYPVWWLVPAEHEQDYDSYVDKLIANRFIKANDIVDFGGLSHLPIEEFFGATLWQLYKAVDSPYKSILKILLMEAYANQHPDIEMLAIRFKKSVHSAEAQLDQLDPYIMMCNTVEEYLFSRRELERLDLARRCFYFKVNEPMSKPDSRREKSWRREAVRELVETWGWSKAKLTSLDQRRQWKIKRVLEERHILVEELTHSYRALSQFGRDSNSGLAIKSADLNLLGRKLYVAFERKAGKVEMINPGVSRDLSEERLSLHRIDENQSGWSIYRGNVLTRDTAEHTPLKRTASLLELLAWCHFNGLVNRNPSTISIQPPECSLSQWELRCVLDCLQQMFPNGKIPESDMQSLADQATIRQAGLFINLAHDPMSKLTRNGMHLVSERVDPLSYGGLWENLATGFEMITVTSWGEVLTFRYAGPAALLDCLCDYFAWLPVSQGKIPPPVPCFSFSSSRGAIIARRLEMLFNDFSEFFYRNYWRRHARYALRIGQNYYVLQCENDIPRYHELNSYTALLNYLGQPQAAFSPIRIDSEMLDDSPLAALLKNNREGVLQMFYRVQGGRAQVYILDERGSLFHQSVAFHDRQTLLSQFRNFFDNIRYRLRNMNVSGSLQDDDSDPLFYQVNRDYQDQYTIDPVKAPNNTGPHRYMDVQIIGDLEDKQHGSFSIFCGNREFSVLEYGNDLFGKVAEHITRQRHSGSCYPIYISDIDVNPTMLISGSPDGVQSVHFLNYKKRIESLLNEALQKIR